MKRSATISECGKYRYSLERGLSESPGKTLLIVGLNPSTADAEKEDRTINRCIGFARAWRFDRLVMTNLFAYRSSYPKDLLVTLDPIGPLNDAFLVKTAASADLILVAWGDGGNLLNRAQHVLSILGPVHCLGVTKGGAPKHPLYVAGETKPSAYKLNNAS